LFCHDGADIDLNVNNHAASVAVHPCYWRALGITEIAGEAGVIDIHDEYRVDARPGLADMRTARFGQVLGELPTIRPGVQGQREFEQWISTTMSVLLEGNAAISLSDPRSEHDCRLLLAQLGSRPTGRFWSRLRDEFGLTLLIGSVSNVETLSPEDVTAAAAANLPGCGRLRLLFSRDDKGLATDTKARVSEVYREEKILVVHVASGVLARCFNKQRRDRRKAYTEKQFSKALEQVRQGCARWRAT